jgi:thiol-disulfide isomerase/thioredoxin
MRVCVQESSILIMLRLMHVHAQCGHCKQLSPIYSRVADNLHGIVVVAAVDCDVESNKQLCGQYGVKGFPTLKIFPASKQKHSKTGRVSKTPEDYNGAQTEGLNMQHGCLERSRRTLEVVRGGHNLVPIDRRSAICKGYRRCSNSGSHRRSYKAASVTD